MTEAEQWRALLGDQYPMYATAPTDGAPNELAQVEKVARALGTPLMPWQKYWVRVATEKTADGRYRYPSVMLTVPRQSGKTTVVRALLATRALLNPGRQAFYTAQSGKDAIERWQELVEQIQRSPFGKTTKIRRAAGSSRITFRNGSKIAPFVPSAESLHGYNGADMVLDEIFHLSADSGSALLGAVIPAQQVHRDKQLIQISTKGTPASTYLNPLIERGRESVTLTTSDMCYMEWTIPDTADPMDRSEWDYHPSLGHTVTKDDIALAAENMTRGEFVRAYMNRMTQQLDLLFDMQNWKDCRSELWTPRRQDVAIGFEVARDRSSAAVVGAWRNPEDRRIHVKLIRNNPGTAWLAPYLLDLNEARPLSIGADNYSQNNIIIDDIKSLQPSMEIFTLKPMSLKTGSESIKAHIEDKTIRHEGNLSLTASVQEAESRPLGDGWALKHSRSPEAFAMLTAVRQVEEVKAESKPAFYF